MERKVESGQTGRCCSDGFLEGVERSQESHECGSLKARKARKQILP